MMLRMAPAERRGFALMREDWAEAAIVADAIWLDVKEMEK